MSSSGLSEAQRVLVLHAGGLGDLVLSTGCLSSLAAALDGRHVTFCCRRDFAGLSGLWPFAFDRLIEIDFDPYSTSPQGASASPAFESLLAAVREDKPDTLLSLELAPTWLTPVLASLVRPRLSLARRHETPSSAAKLAVLERLGLSPFVYSTYESPENQQEARRYATILETLGVPIRPATIAVPAEALEAAHLLLGARGTPASNRLLACFPLGNRNVPAKRWGIDRHIAAISLAVERHGFRPALFGDQTEERELRDIANRLHERGVEALVLTGSPGTLDVIAGALSLCTAFLGNDTGLAHLAAALGAQGVTAYGGGTWPCFEPWAPGMVGIVNLLPCFGCGWDCAFESSLCLEAVEVEAVVNGLDRALSGVGRPVVVALQVKSPAELETIASASATYRAAQADRLRRFDVIVDLQESLRRAERLARLRRDLLLDSERQRSQSDAERVAEVAALELEIERLKTELEAVKSGDDGNLDVGVD